MWWQILLYFFVTLAAGYFITTLFFDAESQSAFKKVALSYGLGVFVLSVLVFVSKFIFRLPNFWSTILIGGLILILAGFYFKRYGPDFKKRLTVEPKKIKWREWLLIVFLSLHLLAAFVLAGLKPVVSWDSLAMWSWKAQVLFYQEADFFNPASDWSWLKQSHPNYPWLVSLTEYWPAAVSGQFNILTINYVFVGFFAALIFLLYGYLRNYLNRFFSLAFVCLLAMMPLIFYHSYNAYADLPLAFYITAAFIFMCKWLQGSPGRYLLLTWLCLAAAMFTKNEAIVFIIAFTPFIILGRPLSGSSWLQVIKQLAWGLVGVVGWLSWLFVNKLSLSNVSGRLGWHPEIFGKFVDAMFIAGSWNIWWYVFFVLSFLFVKQIWRDLPLRLAYGAWLLALGGFVTLYLLTEEYQFAVDHTALSRNLIPLATMSIFLVAQLWRQEFFTNHKLFKD